MAKLKGGLVGCGMISEFHLKGWARIPDVEITALCSRNPANAEERLHLSPGAEIFTDYGKMLETGGLDFVDILTPPFVHKQYCLQAMEAGVHVICQKPITDNLEAGRELVAAFGNYPKLFAIHENHRYRPWFRTVMEKAAEGLFGAIRFCRWEQHNPTEPGVAYKLEVEKGVFLEHGTHLVDMMRALMGEPESVFARMHRVSEKIAGESLTHATYAYENATAAIDVAWKPEGVQQASFLLEGEKGEAYFQGSMVRGGPSRLRLMEGKEVILDEQRDSAADYEESFYLFQLECAEAMLSGDTASIIQTGAENLSTLLATFKAYESAEYGRAVSE